MAAQEETEHTPSHKHTEFTPTNKAMTPKEELGVNWTPSAQQMRDHTETGKRDADRIPWEHPPTHQPAGGMDRRLPCLGAQETMVV